MSISITVTSLRRPVFRFASPGARLLRSEVIGGADGPPCTDEHVAVIAHAVATSVHIRDNLLADVVGDSIKADRLVDVFRCCDDTRRPDMADLAGAGQYITRGSTVAIEAITRHTTGSLGRMANHAASLGLDPKPLIDSINRSELRDRLTVADRQHYRSHVAGHSPLLPNPDPRAPTQGQSLVCHVLDRPGRER
ncbi:hypothetical protein [Citricoccus sp. I39-566]|uniref:hypothetical protein n=1 Tax=Citricoccus sp. I39-566 TaxID=3073268 RepID=UPI00286B5507|nr:hypothetical protein [Citricoccus sp. I39-566]WMY77443.1 hypothetical protein RE421_11380 [Citricoccus sp. I39-566]